MSATEERQRPGTLKEVAARSGSIEDFGYNLRDWQHEIQRGGVRTRKELSARLEERPALLSRHFEEGNIADAYLAAYAEWIADTSKISRPSWCKTRSRRVRDAWYSSPIHTVLEAKSPDSFRRRNLFTIPEPVFTPRRGRPTVSAEQKRHKGILRQRSYRGRIRKLVAQARAMNQ